MFPKTVYLNFTFNEDSVKIYSTTMYTNCRFCFSVWCLRYFEYFLTGLQDYWELLNISENKYEIHTEDN